MKLHLLATAAVAATFLAAPAFAADATGSVGLSASQIEVDAFGLSGDGQSYDLDGSVAFKTGAAWTTTVQANIGQTDGDLGDDTGYGLGAALTYAGSDWRVGPTVSYSDNDTASAWTVGAVAQKYLDKVTLSGGVNYGNIDDIDADFWSVGGEARYFVSDNFRLNGGLTWATADFGGVDVDAWAAGVGGEYQFAGTGWSLTGGYTRTDVSDFDVEADTFTIGVRYSFGGDLKARDRSGADLGAGANPLGVLF